MPAITNTGHNTLSEFFKADIVSPLRSFRSRAQPWKKIRARELRKNATRSEQVLWQEIRNEKLGFKFRRQVVMFGWIVDFYCPSQQLVIELDGRYHDLPGRKEEDDCKDRKLTETGFRVLRIASSRVFNDLPNVLSEIRTAANGGSDWVSKN